MKKKELVKAFSRVNIQGLSKFSYSKKDIYIDFKENFYGKNIYNFNSEDYGYYNKDVDINLPSLEEIENAKQYEEEIKNQYLMIIQMMI